MEPQLHQRHELKLLQKVTPQLITTQHLLLLPHVELSMEIERELEENPVLEETSTNLCPECGQEFSGTACKGCGYKMELPEAPEDFTYQILKSRSEPVEREAEDFPDMPGMQVPSGITLHDHLRLNVLPLLQTEEQKKIAELLIRNISDHGYLLVSLDTISKALKCEEKDVEEVLALVQTLEPAGVGSRNPQEALLIQISQLRQEKEIPACLESMIMSHWDDLLKLKLDKIAKELNVNMEEVKAALSFIQTYLNPYPALGWGGGEARTEGFTSWDVAIRHENGDFVVEVQEPKMSELRLSPSYLKMLKDLKSNPEKFDASEKAYLEQMLERAKTFLRSLNLRREILGRIAQEIVGTQKTFLRTMDKQDLNSLTQRSLAHRLGLSESTISRATSNKAIQLPWKTIVPFSFFFHHSEGVKQKVADLISKEEAAHPLSDSDIAAALREQGIECARRTVAKYREELRIPAGNVRKQQHS